MSSLVLNMVGGGGGGLSATDALLRVRAPAGSTVTITKGGVTKSDAGHENADDHTVYDYYFIIHQSQFDSVNAWTVTATLNGDTASDTIIINAADEYDMELSYNLKLYWDGVQGVPLQQGTETTYGGQAGTVTFNADHIYLYYPNATKWSIIVTTNSVDFSGYSTLYVEVETLSKPSGGTYVAAKLADTRPNANMWNSTGAYAVTDNLLSSLTVNTRQTLSLDISNVNQSAYMGFITESWESKGAMEMKVYRIWAER